MDKIEAEALVKRYLEGNCTPDEEALLESWYLKYQHKDLAEVTEEIRAKRLEEIRAVLPVKGVKQSKIPLMRYAAAASIVIAVSIGMYFYLWSPGIQQETVLSNAEDILPGGNKAVLKLGEGQEINLSGDQDGIVIKADQLVYNDGSRINEAGSLKADYATLSTPKGGQYQVILADGTKVWLNSGSSITYPVKFSTKERRVAITGEVYFEVKHMESAPFKVESPGQLIEVLGTHFNVMAYQEEAITRTTLLSGSVQINRTAKNKTVSDVKMILHPGQQAQLSQQHFELAKAVDLEEIIAWKNGYFKFGESLENIMSKVARWYDIEVVYQSNFEGKLKFVGKISRSKNLSELLNIIESAGGVHFKIEGRRVIVMK